MDAYDFERSVQISSDEDCMTGSSDDEEMSELREWAEVDFWLGQKYFELILLRMIIRGSATGESISSLTTLLHERIHHYPFDQHVKLLQDQLVARHWHDARTKYEDLLTVIGRVQRAGTLEEKGIISKSLTSFGGVPAPKIHPDAVQSEARDWSSIIAHELKPTVQSPMLSEPLPWESVTTLPVQHVATPEHIIKLQECGDRAGEVPEYTSNTRFGRPPITHTKLIFRGRTFEAEGRSKKETRQIVAMQACEAFGVRVM